MIRPKNETEDLLFSITINCECLIQQTHRKAEQTLEIKMIKPRERFHFDPPIQIEEDWVIGLVNIEVYKSIFNINTTNNNSIIIQISFEDFSFEELKDELDEIPNISDITPYRLRHEKIGPRIIEAYRKLGLEKSNTDGYIILLMGETRSLFGDFESCFRIKVGLDGDDVQLILKTVYFKFCHL